MEELVFPIVARFNDSDLRVKYYACESLYNVVKVARSAILSYFPNIFSALSKVATDADQNVKNASELLDRLLKVYFKLHNFAFNRLFFLGHCNRDSFI